MFCGHTDEPLCNPPNEATRTPEEKPTPGTWNHLLSIFKITYPSILLTIFKITYPSILLAVFISCFLTSVLYHFISQGSVPVYLISYNLTYHKLLVSTMKCLGSSFSMTKLGVKWMQLWRSVIGYRQESLQGS